eukprot:scaffold1406_cov115-Isochrysis_galbana.AAC.3
MWRLCKSPRLAFALRPCGHSARHWHRLPRARAVLTGAWANLGVWNRLASAVACFGSHEAGKPVGRPYRRRPSFAVRALFIPDAYLRLIVLPLAVEEQNSMRAWRVTMAPRQLRPEPIEDDMTADKDSK